MSNKKGFTLVEIIAAITILGILTGFGIVSVTKVIANAKEKHYIAAEQNLVLAGQSYAQQNRAVLPKAVGQKTKVKLNLLLEKKYIQEIKDYNDNTCDPEESYVEIYKYSQKDYSYQAYLMCPSYNSQQHIDNNTPEISATIVTNPTNGTISAPVTLTGNGKITSYSYVIYRGTQEVKNTGSIIVNGNTETKSFNIPLTDYAPAQVKVVITVTNKFGNTKTKTITQNLHDENGPECVIRLEDEERSLKDWTNQNRTITIGCNDGDGSGCTEDSYSKTFSSTTKIGIITIEDYAGNQTQCKVSVYVDKTAPECTYDGDSNVWALDRVISYGCEDSNSGCDADYSGGAITQDTTARTRIISSYTIKDNAGNTKQCPERIANVYVDKTPPQCKLSGNSTSWTKNDRTIKYGCNDNDSGCDPSNSGSQLTQTTTAQTVELPAYTIKDNVGNTTECPAQTADVYVDKTPPYVVSVSLDNLTLEQWNQKNNVVTGGYITKKSCDSPESCSAVVCLKDIKGTFLVSGEQALFGDEHSGYRNSYYSGKEIFDKNGNSTEGDGCRKKHIPCTYRHIYQYYDRVGNTDTYTIDFQVGYIGQNDGSGC